MTTTVQEQMKDLVVAINTEQYFVPLFQATMEGHGFTIEGVQGESYTDSEIVSLVNDFWFELPDSPTIRRVPFGLVCDIAQTETEEPAGYGE